MVTARRVRSPPLATLEAFAAAVRLGSLSGAAEALHLTPGAISRQMAALEGSLGVKLFDRHARGVSPTVAGKRFHSAVQEALSLVTATAQDLRSKGESAVEVRISVTPSYGARWLLPRLGRFAAMHPLIRVIPVADNRLVDLDGEGFDLAVRYTAGRFDGYDSVRLMEEDLCVLAAPALLRGKDQTPSGLVRLPLLHDASDEDWRIWLRAIGHPGLLPPRGTVFNDYNLAIEAAVAGLGVVVGRSALVAEELRSGRLVEPIAFRVPSSRAYYAIRPRRTPHPPAQALWSWLLRTSASPSPPSHDH